MIALIGIILLIGIVKKNAIMMIDFALEAERTEGKAPEAAIYEACLLRSAHHDDDARRPVRRPPARDRRRVGESSAVRSASPSSAPHPEPAPHPLHDSRRLPLSRSLRSLVRALARRWRRALVRPSTAPRDRPHVGLSATERRAQAGTGGSSSSKKSSSPVNVRPSPAIASTSRG